MILRSATLDKRLPSPGEDGIGRRTAGRSRLFCGTAPLCRLFPDERPGLRQHVRREFRHAVDLLPVLRRLLENFFDGLAPCDEIALGPHFPAPEDLRHMSPPEAAFRPPRPATSTDPI